jgi:hypothetical protein
MNRYIKIFIFGLTLSISVLSSAYVSSTGHAYCDGSNDHYCRIDYNGVVAHGTGNAHLIIK